MFRKKVDTTKDQDRLKEGFNNQKSQEFIYSK